MTRPTDGVRESFRTLVANVLLPANRDELEPSNHYLWLGPAGQIFLDDDDQRRFSEIVGELAGNQSQGGPHYKHVQRLVRSAVWESADERGGPEVGLDYLDESISRGVRDWKVAMSFPGKLPLDHLQVARCDISAEAPSIPDNISERALEGPAIMTSARAYDYRSAGAVAAAKRDEALSILALDRPKMQRVDTPHTLCFAEDHRPAVYGPTAAAIYPWPIIDQERGRLKDPYHRISEAAARPDGPQPGLERRLLASARLRYRAALTPWPDDRLRFAFSALDALLVDDDDSTGAKVAQATSTILRDPPGLPQSLIDLYRDRNDIVHVGARINRDLDADRVAVLAHECIRRVAWHLVPSHLDRGAACGDLSDLWGCLGDL